MAETTKPVQITPSEGLNKLGYTAAGIFALYLMVSFNFIPEIIGCEFQRVLKESYIAKHFIGLLTALFFVSIASSSLNIKLGEKLGYTVIMYLIFMISNKSLFESQMLFILFIFIAYVLQLVKDEKFKTMQEDPLMTDDQKKKNIVEYDRIGKAQTLLLGTGVLLVVLGHFVYWGKKKLEFWGGGYEDTFSWIKMIKGNKRAGCSFEDKRVYTVSESIAAFFTFSKTATKRAKTAEMLTLEAFRQEFGRDSKVTSGIRWTNHSEEDVRTLILKADRAAGRPSPLTSGMYGMGTRPTPATVPGATLRRRNDGGDEENPLLGGPNESKM
jgi:hypothetical protein